MSDRRFVAALTEVMMERRGSNTPPIAPAPVDETAVAIARAAFADWLRVEREARGISLEDIARVTKIQIRTPRRETGRG